MRSRSRDKQKIWFSKIEEKQDGIDTVQVYSKPKMHRFPVSSTSGTPDEIAAGIVPNYDRYITHNKKMGCSNNFIAEEGMVCWVDVTPKLDADGNLVMQEDMETPVMPPDYVLKKILDTQKGIVARYGISKIGGSE